MDKKIIAVFMVLIVAAGLVFATATANIPMPTGVAQVVSSGNSVAYYLKVLNANLVNGVGSTMSTATPAGCPAGFNGVGSACNPSNPSAACPASSGASSGAISSVTLKGISQISDSKSLTFEAVNGHTLGVVSRFGNSTGDAGDAYFQPAVFIYFDGKLAKCNSSSFDDGLQGLIFLVAKNFLASGRQGVNGFISGDASTRVVCDETIASATKTYAELGAMDKSIPTFSIKLTSPFIPASYCGKTYDFEVGKWQ